MTAEENKAIIRRLVEEVWNQGKLEVLDEILSPDHDHRDVSTPGLRGGREGEKSLVTTYRSAFPDMRLTIEDLIAEGDEVVHRWTVRGTHRGELMGIPPTGKQVTVTGTSVDRIQNGRIMASWVNWDALGMLEQFGVTVRGRGAERQ